MANPGDYQVKDFRALKAFLETLTEEQLNFPIVFFGVELAGTMPVMTVLVEDWVNPDGYGSEPRAAWQAAALGEEGLSEEEKTKIREEPSVLVRGQPVFSGIDAP